jgi:hypothetical protein
MLLGGDIKNTEVTASLTLFIIRQRPTLRLRSEECPVNSLGSVVLEGLAYIAMVLSLNVLTNPECDSMSRLMQS